MFMTVKADFSHESWDVSHHALASNRQWVTLHSP